MLFWRYYYSALSIEKCMSVDVNLDGMLPIAMVISSANGHIEIVKLLLELGAKVGNNGVSALIIIVASENGHLEIVKLLVKSGAKVDMQSALITASANGHLEIVKFILESGAKVDMQDKNGISALMKASALGHIDIVEVLLDRGALLDGHSMGSGALMITDPVRVLGGNYSSPLVIACVLGRIEVVRLLLDRGAKVNIVNYLSSPLIAASSGGHTKIVKLLLDHGAEVSMENTFGMTPLIAAICSTSHKQSMQLFAIELSSIIKSGMEGHIETVKLLLEHGAQVNIQYKMFNNRMTASPLMFACSLGSVATLDLLLNHGADVNMPVMHDLSALHLTSMLGSINKALFKQYKIHIEALKFLLSNGAEVNILDNNGASPLHAASFAGDTESVKLLIDHNAQVDLQNNHGWSPLHLTSFNGKTETKKRMFEDLGVQEIFSEALSEKRIETAGLLLDHGSQVNIQDKHGRSPLMIASSIGDADMVKFLLDRRAEVNLKDNDGCSALAIASLAGKKQNCTEVVAQNEVVETSILQREIKEHAETVKVLLYFGAEVDAKDHHGLSAQLIASSNGHIEILQLLLDHGSQIDPKAIDIARESNHVEVVQLLSSQLYTVIVETSAEASISNTSGKNTEMFLIQELLKKFEDRQMEQMHNYNYTVQKMEQMQTQITLLASALPNYNLQGNSTTPPHQQHSNDLTLNNLLRELVNLASDWKYIGGLLNLDSGKLDAIEHDRHHLARNCLQEMIAEWLKTIDPPPSWELLAEAVEVIDKGKAKEIRDKYCTAMATGLGE